MAKDVDLDLVVREPVVIRFKGEKYVFEDPSMLQHLKHTQMVSELDKLRDKLDRLFRDENRDNEEYERVMNEFQKYSQKFDRDIIKLFVPGLEKQFDVMTAAQKNKVLAIIFGEEEDKAGETEKKSQESPPKKEPEKKSGGEA